MIASVLIMLATNFPFAWYLVPVALILCREIGVSALREWMAEKGYRSIVKVGAMGKVKTAFQMIAASILLLALAIGSPLETVQHAISHTPVATAVGGSAVAGAVSTGGVVHLATTLLSALSQDTSTVFLGLGMLFLYASTALALVSGKEYFDAALPVLLQKI